MTSNPNFIAHSATLVKDHHSNSLHVAAKNGVLQRRVNFTKEKPFKAELSANHLKAKVSAKTEERNALASKNKKLVLDPTRMSGLA